MKLSDSTMSEQHETQAANKFNSIKHTKKHTHTDRDTKQLRIERKEMCAIHSARHFRSVFVLTRSKEPHFNAR